MTIHREDRGRADVPDPPDFVGTGLRAIYAVNRELAGGDEEFELAKVTIYTVEIYEDGIVVRWLTPPPDPPDGIDDMPFPRLTIEDDLGTRYLYAGGTTGGGLRRGQGRRGESTFAGRVPLQGASLLLRSSESTLRVDLTQPAVAFARPTRLD